MERTYNKQPGFSIVELLIAIVAIGVIGATGWFVYQHNRLQPTSAATGGKDQVTPTTLAPSANATAVVKIPELGVQVTVPNNLKDLTYQVNTVTLSNGNKAAYALLSTTALTAADAQCGTRSAALGSLETASGQYPGNDPYAAFNYGPLLKQFPTFYVTYAAPQAGCATGTSARSALSTDAEAFKAALSTIQPLN